MAMIAIVQPTDLARHVRGETDSAIRGILKWAPPDIGFTLFAATSDARVPHLGSNTTMRSTERTPFVPPTMMGATAKRGAALLRCATSSPCDDTSRPCDSLVSTLSTSIELDRGASPHLARRHKQSVQVKEVSRT